MNVDLSPCPHCGGETSLAENTRLRWVCAVCGGPRIPGFRGASAALTKTRRTLAEALGASLGAIVLGVVGALVAGLGALAWSVHVPVLAMALAAAATVMELVAWRRSARAGAMRRGAREALDGAWREAALQTLRGRQMRAQDLAKEMQIDEAYAEHLLTELSARDQARIEIDDGAVRYRVDSDAEPRTASGADEAQSRGRLE